MMEYISSHVILSHLQLWIASARHNFKLVKIIWDVSTQKPRTPGQTLPRLLAFI